MHPNERRPRRAFWISCRRYLPGGLLGGAGGGVRMTSRSVVFGCLSAYFSVVNLPVSDRRWTTLVMIDIGELIRLTTRLECLGIVVNWMRVLKRRVTCHVQVNYTSPAGSQCPAGEVGWLTVTW